MAAQPAVAATPATAAVGGPAELVWWSLLTLGRTIDKTSVLPFLGFAKRCLLAPDRTSAAARADPTSHVRATSDILVRWIRAGAGPVADPMLARFFYRLAGRIEALPDELRSGAFDADVLETELRDDVAYGTRSGHEQDTITLARLQYVEPAYPSLHELLKRLASQSSKGTSLTQLTRVLTTGEAKQPLFARLEPIDTFLAGHAAFLTQCWNKSLSVDGADGVVALLLKDHKETQALGGGWAAAPGDADARLNDDDLVGSRRSLSEAAIRRVLQDAAFVDAAEEILALDLDTPSGRKEALEIALLSQSFAYQRFFAKPAALVEFHAAFKALWRCFDQLPALFGGAQAADPVTGTVPPLLVNWVFPMESIECLFRAKISSLSFFNGQGGALALFNLTASKAFLECPKDQLFIVPAVLELTIPFVRATMVTAGWAATSTVGYTLTALYERQLRHVKWIEGMDQMEQKTLYPHAQLTMEAALLEADRTVRRMLDDPEPVDVVLSYVVPFGGAYDNELATKTEGAAPILMVRRAFPHLLPEGPARSLPGVVLSSSGAGSSGTSGSAVDTSGDKDKDKDKNKNKKTILLEPRAPGSQSGFATWTDETHMRLGTLVYDVDAIAQHYKVNVGALCWPVVCSNKRGGHVLCLCANWGEAGHTALLSAAHKRPPKWDLAYVEKHFAAKSTVSGSKRKGPAK